MAKSNEQVTEDLSYLDGLEGVGTENMAGQTATAYLSMVQPDSTLITEDCLPGTWRNSATGESYGPSVRVIPLKFETVWTERDSEPPFMTVGRYRPHSIEVDIVRPKPGKRGYPTYRNKETGNKIEELYIYAVALEERLEAGILYFSPTVGSMRTCKQWNSQLMSQRLPNPTDPNKPMLAPLCAYSWVLDLSIVDNPAQPGKKITRFSKVTRGTAIWQVKDLMVNTIKPALLETKNVSLLAAPEASGDVESAD